MNQALFQRLVVLFVIMMYRSLHPKLVAFQKIVKAASAHLGKGGPDAFRLAKVANVAAKKELGEDADAEKLAAKAIVLMRDNIDDYKKEAIKAKVE
jgi:hypothetical protein